MITLNFKLSYFEIHVQKSDHKAANSSIMSWLLEPTTHRRQLLSHSPGKCACQVNKKYGNICLLQQVDSSTLFK